MIKRDLSWIVPIGVACLIILIPVLCNLYPTKPEATIDGKERIKLLSLPESQEQELALDEYLVGVVAGEMPAAFDVEALKAQAIAARTYTLYRLNLIKDTKHPGRICNQPAHCQEYLTQAELKQRWGNRYEAYLKKIRAAIRATDGMVLTYDQQLIEPVYHASCGGVGTESAIQVWGNDKPWLQSVSCPEKERLDADQVRKVTYSKEHVLTQLNQSLAAPVATTSSPGIWKVIQKTSTGRVQKLRLGNIDISGTELRSSLSLRSTVLSLEDQGEKVTFVTRGYGHGVGLCQEGANLLALEGQGYQEIIRHYYQGIEIMQIKK